MWNLFFVSEGKEAVLDLDELAPFLAANKVQMYYMFSARTSSRDEGGVGGLR